MSNRKKTKAIAVFSIVCILFTACNKQKKITDSQPDVTPQFSEVAISKENTFSNNSLYIEYPIDGEKAFVESVRLWIDTVLCYNPFMDNPKFEKFSGNHDSLELLAQYYLSNKIADIKDKDEIKQFRAMGMKYECFDSVFTCFKGEKLTSYNYISFLYLGGAHGGTLLQTATFNNHNGDILTWDIITDKDTLQSMIQNGLMQYFEVATVSELTDMLIIDDITSIALPQALPFFNNEGLVLCYQQYEIAPYAAGMPTVVISWDKCSAILPQDIMALLATDIMKHSTNVSKDK